MTREMLQSKKRLSSERGEMIQLNEMQSSTRKESFQLSMFCCIAQTTSCSRFFVRYSFYECYRDWFSSRQCLQLERNAISTILLNETLHSTLGPSFDLGSLFDLHSIVDLFHLQSLILSTLDDEGQRSMLNQRSISIQPRELRSLYHARSGAGRRAFAH